MHGQSPYVLTGSTSQAMSTAGRPFTLSLCSKVGAEAPTRFRTRQDRVSEPVQDSTFERSLLSFQRPAPHLRDGVKKPPTLAPEASERRIVSDTSRALEAPWSTSCRDFRTPLVPRLG